MDSLKILIFAEVRNNHEKSETLSDAELNQLMFRNPSGMRLNFPGFLILKNIFTAYSFEIPFNLTAKHFIGMGKMEFPYFVTAKRLVLFSEVDSMVIKLYGGIEGFLDNCYTVDR